MKYIIGYYKTPLKPYRVYVQDTYSYAYLEDMEVDDSKINQVLEDLRSKYADSNVCEFKYY